jgi:hypothetical protein
LTHPLFRVAAGVLLLLLSALFPASAQSHPALARETHHYDLADPALARAAQRYDWAQEGKGNRADLEKLVADDYVLFRASGKVIEQDRADRARMPSRHFHEPIHR